ncbi:MAG: nuclear transport factor 2 family protein [Steroidobacteraceae bacterium]
MRAAFFLVALALASLCGACATTQSRRANSAVELRHQADAWDRAIVAKDLTAVGQNMAQSFRHIDSEGRLSNKAEFLAGITSAKLVIHPYEPRDVEIRFYGGAAVITGTTELHGTYDGKAFVTQYRYSDVYARESGAWRVVSVQTTEIAK